MVTKYGWMVTMDVFQSIAHELNSDLGLLIIPTVMIPLTAVSVLLTMIATFIAGLFGITLKAEGPKKLLEVLLKPKILVGALILNGLILGGVWGYEYYQNLPSFIFTIKNKQKQLALNSEINYTDVLRRPVKKNRVFKDKEFSGLNVQQDWSVKIPKGVFRSGVLSGGRLFLGSMDGLIYEIDPKEGKIIRKFFVGTFVSPGLVIHDNVLYSGEGTHSTHYARIYAFNLKTGLLQSTYETKGHTEGSPVIASFEGKTKLLAPSGSDGMHAINLSDMKRSWRTFDGHVDASAFTDNGLVFAGTGREKGDASKHRSFAVAYNFNNGEKVWKNELPASSWMSPTGWKEEVCFVFGEVYFLSGVGGVNCYDQKTGNPTKSFNLNHPVTGMSTVVADDLFTSDSKGTVCSLSLRKNEVNWCRSFKTKGKSFASPVYDPSRDVLAYASKSDGFYLLDPDSGEILTKWVGVNPAGKDKTKSGKTSVWKSHFAGAIPYENGYILSDISGNIRKISLVKKEYKIKGISVR